MRIIGDRPYSVGIPCLINFPCSGFFPAAPAVFCIPLLPWKIVATGQLPPIQGQVSKGSHFTFGRNFDDQAFRAEQLLSGQWPKNRYNMADEAAQWLDDQLSAVL